MCLFKGSRKICIAEHDIECYKILYSDMSSMYFHFKYKLGEHYCKIWDSAFINECDKKTCLGENMFHADLNKDYIIWLYGNKYETNNEKIVRVSVGDNQVLVKCIIPKGSKYYLGTSGEIGTEQIIIKEIVNETK